jgi:hypothetical protein
LSQHAILFVDLLGTRSRWQLGGRSEVELTCLRFEAAVRSALSATPTAVPLDGGVETDCAALVFESAEHAVAVGCELYLQTFRSAQSQYDERHWLRGAIVPFTQGAELRVTAPLSASLSQVKVHKCLGDLMDAIAVEKSGFKGMRLLIHPDLVDSELAARFRIAVGAAQVYALKRLTFSAYPTCAEQYQDVLWMVTRGLAGWEEAELSMVGRLRWAAKVPDEFLQAAATQVVFHECGAIIDDLRRRAP